MNLLIDKNSRIPLYEQLRTQLTNAICNGELKVGDKMPTEEELCQQYNISRPVCRQAYAALINDRLIVRERGKGTFVRFRDLSDNIIDTSFNFNQEMINNGLTPRTELLSIEKIKFDASIFSILKLEKKDIVWRIERMRFADQQPYVYMINYLPEKYFPQIDQYDFNHQGLYSVMEEYYQQEVVKAHRKISAILCDKNLSKHLNCEKNTPVLVFDNIGTNKDNIVIDYCMEYFDGNERTFEFDVTKR